METRSILGVTLLFDKEEADAAEIIGGAIERSVALLHDRWGLATPAECWVYVMTSPARFVFQSAPWYRKLWLVDTWPFWYFRAKSQWAYAGGWSLQVGRRQVVGVKPPRLMQAAEHSLGAILFIPTDIHDKVQHVTCHELTHAFAQHLKLPPWLNEGLALLTVDYYAGKPTVRPDTLNLLERAPHRVGRDSYRTLRPQDKEAIVATYARGYWLARYMAETQPAALRELLSRRSDLQTLEDKVAEACGLGRGHLWSDIDATLIARYGDAGPGEVSLGT